MQASVPRRHQEQHRDKAFRLAVPALLSHRDLGPCGDQGAGGGGRPPTLVIGWLVGWLYVGFHCLGGGYCVIRL
jgi:hypothetical protein